MGYTHKLALNLTVIYFNLHFQRARFNQRVETTRTELQHRCTVKVDDVWGTLHETVLEFFKNVRPANT